jgi:alkanesulfonate monooxygenase SsuD/methylene tetrahydromethanopterin reductase-like flavin-dependent oxidoreductase (luciferase family)
VVPVICAETSEEADRLSLPSAVSFVKLRQGHPTPLPSPEDAAAYEFTAMERELLRQWEAPLVRGNPQEVRSQLIDLINRTRVDEVMVTTMVHNHQDRVRSYQLLAEVWGLTGAETRAEPDTRYDDPSNATPTTNRITITSAAAP